jgi:hypothetical protein
LASWILASTAHEVSPDAHPVFDVYQYALEPVYAAQPDSIVWGRYMRVDERLVEYRLPSLKNEDEI